MQKFSKILLIFWMIGIGASVYFLFFVSPSETIPLTDWQTLPSPPLSGREIKDTTWSIIKNDILSLNMPESEDKTLRVLIPKYLYHDGFKQLARDLLLDQNIKVSYKTVASLEAYKQLLSSGVENYNIDIALVPVDWLDGFATTAFDFSEPLNAYFHPLFASRLSGNISHIMPYALDPLVTYVHTWVNIPNTSLEQLFSYSMLRNQKKQRSMPLVWWKWNFEHADEILYYLLADIVAAQDWSAINYFLDLYDMKLTYTYTRERMLQMVTALAKRNTSCETFPSLCLFAYGFADMRFWYLSDQILISQSFTGEWTSTDYLFRSFPHHDTNDYFMRWWAFIVLPNTTHWYTSMQFLKHYLDTTLSWSDTLWTGMLSASPLVFDQQIGQKAYADIENFSSYFVLMHGGLTTQKDFLSATPTLDLLKGSYNPMSYLSMITRTW